jgi:hypothetical protein
MTSDQDRRKFLGTAAGAVAFTVVPRHVLGGQGNVAPSDKITLAMIGVGTQALRELPALLSIPEIRIVSVCDPCKNAVGYSDWSSAEILNSLRKALGKPGWRAGTEGTIPGGRDVGKDAVDTYYGSAAGNGCSSYADYRELLDKEKDLNAVKIMTPDHLHAVASIAAMQRGKHVMVHKPLANRLQEAKLVIDTARATGVATHFLPWDSNGYMDQVMGWIKDGAIGTLREVHNWTNRPVWPQYATMPADTPPIPAGFDWDLWLGPEAYRPYHPNYTHMVFRGWYDFGGGAMADMGHYSLWTVFNALELSEPVSVEPMVSHDCVLKDSVSSRIKNDFSFPAAGVVRFRYPARGQRPAVDLIWYEGGMRPPTPPELEEDHLALPSEGVMFVGDKGKAIAEFYMTNPRLVPQRRMRDYAPDTRPQPRQSQPGAISPGMRAWVGACRGGPQSPGSFLNAGPISEAVNLYAIAERTGQRLLYDAANTRITNSQEANRYLSREYRKGWEIKA